MVAAALAAPLVAQRPQTSFQSRPRRAARLVVRAVEAPLATDFKELQSSAAAVRKALLARGWDLAWVDGVTGEITRRRLGASVSQIEAAVSFLEGLGIPLKGVENMAAINKAILAQPVEALKAVADYAQRQGATGQALVHLLEAHPNLLTYAVSADGTQLEKGAARASVDVVERGGARVAGVSYWRQGATFASAPVAPYKPTPL